MRRAFLAMALAACSSPHGTTTAPDAGPTPGCAALCAHERTLGCPEAAPTHAGTSCEDVCSRAQTIQPWPLDAMAVEPSCSAIATDLERTPVQ